MEACFQVDPQYNMSLFREFSGTKGIGSRWRRIVLTVLQIVMLLITWLHLYWNGLDTFGVLMVLYFVLRMLLPSVMRSSNARRQLKAFRSEGTIRFQFYEDELVVLTDARQVRAKYAAFSCLLETEHLLLLQLDGKKQYHVIPKAQVKEPDAFRSFLEEKVGKPCKKTRVSHDWVRTIVFLLLGLVLFSTPFLMLLPKWATVSEYHVPDSGFVVELPVSWQEDEEEQEEDWFLLYDALGEIALLAGDPEDGLPDAATLKEYLQYYVQDESSIKYLPNGVAYVGYRYGQDYYSVCAVAVSEEQSLVMEMTVPKGYRLFYEIAFLKWCGTIRYEGGAMV